MFPVKYWESVLFPKRIRRYSGAMLDKLLAEGDYFWRMTPEGNLCFCRYEDIDWDAPLPKGAESLEGDELLMYRELARRGASFLKFLTGVPKEDSAQEVLLLSLIHILRGCIEKFVEEYPLCHKSRIVRIA